MSMYILANWAEMIQAANEMNAAMEVYEEAVEAAKTAAADLASKWEGATKEAFVVHQENAYTWHKNILSIVTQMISTVRKVIELYEQTETAVTNIVKG